MRLTILTLLAVLAAAAPAAEAQTGYIPYYGKNAIRYDRFEWHIYQTDHFEIYYYPEIEPHLERIAGYAESAYQHVSSELKHDLAFRVPLILFSTSSEFWQQNVTPGAAQEGVGAFAEPSRSRIVMPIDEPSDLLYRLITHELTHVFQFDIIPTGLIRRNMPLWTMEGMSDYMTGYWRPLDLMTVRDAAVSDIIPKMSEMASPLKIGSSRMKKAPSIAARPVSRIGCARVAAERVTASASGTPSASCRLMKSTSRIELRTMMPASAIMPIMLVAVNCAWSSAWPGITPTIVSGMGAMMISGVRYEPNWATTSR